MPRRNRVAGAKFGACKLASGSRVSSHFHHTGEELFYRGTQGSGTIFFTSCNMRCAFCQNGDISTDKDNGEETDPRTLATMAWTLRREGCHNINWVGGEVVIHLHSIVDAIALLGRDFMPTARDYGLVAGIFSAYRPPAFGVGGFSDKFNSLHAYGLAVDLYGIGRPGSVEALWWHEIAAKHGLICPYGHHDKAEWNHCQPTGLKAVSADNLLRETITADGPVSLEAMFEAGNSAIERPANAADTVGRTHQCGELRSARRD